MHYHPSAESKAFLLGFTPCTFFMPRGIGLSAGREEEKFWIFMDM